MKINDMECARHFPEGDLFHIFGALHSGDIQPMDILEGLKNGSTGEFTSGEAIFVLPGCVMMALFIAAHRGESPIVLLASVPTLSMDWSIPVQADIIEFDEEPMQDEEEGEFA